jgi:hypothetical protein
MKRQMELEQLNRPGLHHAGQGRARLFPLPGRGPHYPRQGSPLPLALAPGGDPGRSIGRGCCPGRRAGTQAPVECQMVHEPLAQQTEAHPPRGRSAPHCGPIRRPACPESLDDAHRTMPFLEQSLSITYIVSHFLALHKSPGTQTLEPLRRRPRAAAMNCLHSVLQRNALQAA